MQLDTNISTPEILFFNVLFASSLKEDNQTAVPVPDQKDNWFILWGCLIFGAFFTAGALAGHTYTHCNNPHRHRGLANNQAVHHPEYDLSEETKEDITSRLGPVVV
tara:strand:- start:401 stop:718 length:318 start_codon:yes stop_codon:yes gene_type:complete